MDALGPIRLEPARDRHGIIAILGYRVIRTLGEPHYTPPEQVDGRNQLHRGPPCQLL